MGTRAALARTDHLGGAGIVLQNGRIGTSCAQRGPPAFVCSSARFIYHFAPMTFRVVALITLFAATCQAQKPASATRDQQVAQAASALQPKLVEIRRELHMHPELSNREERTGRLVAERLRSIGYTDIKTGIARTGVVAVLKGGR